MLNQVKGKIVEVNVSDGDEVKKGECLYRIDCSEQESQKEYLEKQIQQYSQKKEYLLKYKQSVEEDKNLFKKAGAEEEYYVKFESYYLNYQTLRQSSQYNKKLNAYTLASYEEQLNRKNQEYDFYTQLKIAIQQGKNQFVDQGEQSKYYVLYENYTTGYEKLKQQYEAQANEITQSTTKEGLLNSLEYYNKKKEGLEQLIKSIQKKKSYFNDNSSYALQYEEYESKIGQLTEEYEIALDEYNMNFELAEYGVSASEIEISELKMKNAKQAITDYKNTFLADAKAKLTEVKQNIQDIKLKKNSAKSISELLKDNKKQKNTALKNYKAEYMVSLNRTIDELENSKKSIEDAMEKAVLEKEKLYELDTEDKVADSSVYMCKISELENIISLIKTCEEKLSELEIQLESVKGQIAHANVTASIDGTVSSMVELVEGDVLADGMEIMTIMPNQNSAYKVNIYVENADIAKIKKDMEIKLNVYALPYTEYGYLLGRVTNISEDYKVNSEQTTGYYLIEAELENVNLYDKDGKKAQLKSGMAGQAKIITGEKSILEYVLEQLDLWIHK